MGFEHLSEDKRREARNMYLWLKDKLYLDNYIEVIK